MNEKQFQFECGKMQGFVSAKDFKKAFRKLMRVGHFHKKDWGKLCRFRQVSMNEYCEYKRVKGVDGYWFYITPEILFSKEGDEL